MSTTSHLSSKIASKKTLEGDKAAQTFGGNCPIRQEPGSTACDGDAVLARYSGGGNLRDSTFIRTLVPVIPPITCNSRPEVSMTTRSTALL